MIYRQTSADLMVDAQKGVKMDLIDRRKVLRVLDGMREHINPWAFHHLQTDICGIPSIDTNFCSRCSSDLRGEQNDKPRGSDRDVIKKRI